MIVSYSFKAIPPFSHTSPWLGPQLSTGAMLSSFFNSFRIWERVPCHIREGIQFGRRRRVCRRLPMENSEQSTACILKIQGKITNMWRISLKTAIKLPVPWSAVAETVSSAKRNIPWTQSDFKRINVNINNAEGANITENVQPNVVLTFGLLPGS